jgi:hypothetical protein
MIGSLRLQRLPKKVGTAELLFGFSILIDAGQRILQFDQRLDGVDYETGVALAVLTPLILTMLLVLATRKRSKVAALLILGLVVLGTSVTALDFAYQGELSIWWLAGGAAIALQAYAAVLFLTAEGRAWLRLGSSSSSPAESLPAFH